MQGYDANTKKIIYQRFNIISAILPFKLLTYEPFEKISGDEKKYIDAVLAGENSLAQSYPLYYVLMTAFQKDIESAYWEEKYKVTDSEDSKMKSKEADSEAAKKKVSLLIGSKTITHYRKLVIL